MGAADVNWSETGKWAVRALVAVLVWVSLVAYDRLGTVEQVAAAQQARAETLERVLAVQLDNIDKRLGRIERNLGVE